MEAILAGRPRPAQPEGDDDAVNARWRNEDATVDFSEGRERAHRAYERRLRLIEEVPEDCWTNALLAIANAEGHQHYANHRQYVQFAGAGV